MWFTRSHTTFSFGFKAFVDEADSPSGLDAFKNGFSFFGTLNMDVFGTRVLFAQQ
jgi:hypothetical protein